MVTEVRRAEVSLSDAGQAEVKSVEYTDTFFVHATRGSDTNNGLSWSDAFATLTYALAQASAIAGDVTQIFLSAEQHDMNSATPTISRQVHIRGSKMGVSEIVNTNATATEVLEITIAGVAISNLEIVPAGTQDGIVINSVNHIHLDKIEFDCRAVTGAQDALQIAGGASETFIGDIIIYGAVASTTGIHIVNGTLTEAFQANIITCLIGLHIENAASDLNLFELTVCSACATGIQLDAGDNNIFNRTDFIGNTTNIDDSGTNTLFCEIHNSALIASIAPANLTGTALTAGVGANTYPAADTQVRAAAAATEPFYVIGFVWEVDTQEKFGIRLSEDGGTTHFYESIVETRAGGINRADRLLIEKYLVHQGTAIHASVKSETGGNTLTFWLLVQTI